MQKQVVLIKGAVETLEFFSEEMAKTLREEGVSVAFWDMKNPTDSRERIVRFLQQGETALWTFNFIGMSGESMFADGEISLWERYGVECCCIMVDHPLYYGRQLASCPDDTGIICVDRGHVDFVRRYYPRFSTVLFMPLAGTMLSAEQIPYRDREIELLFAGNYVQLPMLEMQLAQLEPDYRDFYYDRIYSLIRDPDRAIEAELTEALVREFPDITDEQLMETMYHMCVVDLYVRSYFRRKIICALAENGFRIHILGKDWDRADCGRPENLIMAGEVDSLTCLQSMQNAKMALNVMPWFKRGAHDRIFNGMLQGCVVISDSSEYLDSVIRDKREFRQFSLEKTDRICDIIEELRREEGAAQRIAETGRALAAKEHTWANRVRGLIRELE